MTATTRSKTKSTSPATKTSSNHPPRVSKPPSGFTTDYTDEPHASRRMAILAKYPEIKKLYGHDPQTKYIATFLVILQLASAAYVCDKPWWQFLTVCYVIGGTANHMLMLAMHEASHNLLFRRPLYNKVMGLVANLPLGVPSAISFKRYHMEHHRYQGQPGIDVDIPTSVEGQVFQSSIMKFAFVVFQVLFYAFRPLVVNPKSPSTWELVNAATAVTFDLVLVLTLGPSALGYCLLSTLLGSGLHPVAGHFIAEHYVFHEGVETYSYYGILNIFAFNVGYHNEHHDFPFIPGSRLPQVRAIASEFYDNLPQHSSWCRVIYDYIMDPNVNAYSRVTRNRMSDEEMQKFKKANN